LAAHFVKQNTKNCGGGKARVRQQPSKTLKLYIRGVYLKKSEPILLAGSAGGRGVRGEFRPPSQKAEAERTISSFSNPALRDCSALPSSAANSFIFLFQLLSTPSNKHFLRRYLTLSLPIHLF